MFFGGCDGGCGFWWLVVGGCDCGGVSGGGGGEMVLFDYSCVLVESVTF